MIMNVATLPDVFDLSSLSRALDEDIAAQELAAIDRVPMDVDDKWTTAPDVHMGEAPRPWYNPEPQPEWNNLELELEDLAVENASQDVLGWYVDLREPNDPSRPTWRNSFPVVSVRKMENAREMEALIPSTLPAHRSWYNSKPQPAWNNLELELESPPVKDACQEMPGWYVDPVENAHVWEAPNHAPCPGYNPQPQPARNNLELEPESPPIENTLQLPELNDQPHPNSFLVVSVRKVGKARVRKASALVPPTSATLAKKAHFRHVLVSAMKGRIPIVLTPARKAGKARVPGILLSARKAEKAHLVRNAEKIIMLDAPPSARKLEKSRAPSAPPSPRVPEPPMSTSACPMPVVPLWMDFSNMSSSSKVKLEDMPMVDEYPVHMRVLWPTVSHTVQPVPPRSTNSHHHHHRESPITRAYQSPANEDVVKLDNNYIEPTDSVSTQENENTAFNNTHLANLTEPLHEPVIDPKEEVSTSAEEVGEEDSQETETEEERQARVARVMAEVFGDGEDSDDDEPLLAKDKAVSLDHPSTSATSDFLTVDVTESVTDWSLDTPNDAGTEGNGSVRVADEDESDEEFQVNYRAHLLVDIFGSDVEDGQSKQQATSVPAPDTATGDSRKRKREDDKPSPIPCFVTMDPRKRKCDDDVRPASTVVTRDPRKRRREDLLPTPVVNKNCGKRKREDELPPAPSLVTKDPRKRLKG